jgi:hypothetical protein
VEERRRRNRWIKRKLHKSNQPRRMFVPAGSKSTANEQPAPDEEMQWKYEVDEFGEVNDIDNVKMRRWVYYGPVVAERPCLCRLAREECFVPDHRPQLWHQRNIGTCAAAASRISTSAFATSSPM